MNAGICIYDLPPHVQEHEIEAARVELVKRLKLFRITFLLNSLPAVTPAFSPESVTPGAVTAGASHMENFA
jgi:hypothetical protein